MVKYCAGSQKLCAKVTAAGGQVHMEGPQVHMDVSSAMATAAFGSGQCHYCCNRLPLVPLAY